MESGSDFFRTLPSLCRSPLPERRHLPIAEVRPFCLGSPYSVGGLHKYTTSLRQLTESQQCSPTHTSTRHDASLYHPPPRPYPWTRHGPRTPQNQHVRRPVVGANGPIHRLPPPRPLHALPGLLRAPTSRLRAKSIHPTPRPAPTAPERARTLRVHHPKRRLAP